MNALPVDDHETQIVLMVTPNIRKCSVSVIAGDIPVFYFDMDNIFLLPLEKDYDSKLVPTQRSILV